MRKLVQAGCADITAQIVSNCCGHKPMARGGFGSVYQGELYDGTLVAIKCLEIFEDVCWLGGGHKSVKVRILSIAQAVLFTHLNYLVSQRAAREVYTWSKCDHPNVLPLLGIAQFRGYIAMISSWQKNGRLDLYVSRCSSLERLDLVSHCTFKSGATCVKNNYHF
jgi:hypothetical protein